MTQQIVSDPTTILQSASLFASKTQSGRRAYGPQRQVSPETLACYIAESIITHRQQGQDRPISFYTLDPHLQALVRAQLTALAKASDVATPSIANPPYRVGNR